jgi:hypothetical protein
LVFSDRYYGAGLWDELIDFNSSDAMSSFGRMLAAVERSKYKSYHIVDEYDSFANRTLFNMVITSAADISMKRDSRSNSTVESILIEFGDMVKDGSANAITRMLFTGITPMAFFDGISGLNIVKDISSLPQFASTFGLSEDDLKTVLSKLSLTEEERSDHLMNIRKYFKGYRFDPRQEDGGYNPQTCFHYFHSLIDNGKLQSLSLIAMLGILLIISLNSWLTTNMQSAEIAPKD